MFQFYTFVYLYNKKYYRKKVIRKNSHSFVNFNSNKNQRNKVAFRSSEKKFFSI